MTVDYADWQTPQAHATAIANTGVPLLSRATVLGNFGATVIAAGASATLGPFAVTQIGYELGLFLLCNVASAYPFMNVQLVWTDSVSGIITDQQTWSLSASSSGSGHQFTGYGPTGGDTLTVTIVNNDTVNSITYQLTLAQNSRAYVRHAMRQIGAGTVPGFTNPSFDPPSNFLVQTGALVAAAGNLTRLIPIYAGVVRVWVTGNLAFDVSIFSINRNISSSTTGNQVFEATVAAAAGGIVANQFALPRCCSTIVVTNNGAGNNQIDATIVVQEQDV